MNLIDRLGVKITIKIASYRYLLIIQELLRQQTEMHKTGLQSRLDPGKKGWYFSLMDSLHFLSDEFKMAYEAIFVLNF